MRRIGKPGGKFGRRERLHNSHDPATTVLTEVGDAGGKRERGTDPQVLTAQIEQVATVTVGEQAEVANAHETRGQNMEQKTA